MTVSLSLLAGAGWQFFDDNGNPLSGGLLYTYEAGTTTPQTTYTDSNGNVANANPIVLDAAGRVPYQVWLTGAATYKFILKTSTGVTVWSEDDVPAEVDFATLAASSGSSLIGFLQAGTGAVARTAQSKMRDVVSVKDFGAVGDGVADDTAAIQAALNASYGVYFPSGTYLVSSTLTLRTRHNLKGESAQSTTLQANTNITVLSATDKQRIVIEDLEIFGIGKATSTGSGIQLVNTPYCVFSRVYIIGFNRGVYMKAGGAAPSSNFSNTIRESTIIYNNFNIDCESESNNLTLIACTFGGTGTSYGVRFKDSNTLAIFGGDCEGVTSCCVYVDSAVPLVTGFGLVVSGVHFESNTCSAGDIVFGVTNSLSGASITGNLFYGAAGNATPLSLQYADGVDFSGNTVTGTYTSKTPLLGTVNNIHYRGNYPVTDVPNLAMNGITFPATQTPSADPNTLDDYEEGTWTPTWSGLTVVGTPTYTGRYIKIGRQVTCHLYVTSTTSTASTAGTTKITGGFPAAMSATPANIAGVTAADASTVASYGVGLVNQAGSEVYTPTWAASATVAVSFSYLSAQ